jgi:hypothetical protein
MDLGDRRDKDVVGIPNRDSSQPSKTDRSFQKAAESGWTSPIRTLSWLCAKLRALLTPDPPRRGLLASL